MTRYVDELNCHWISKLQNAVFIENWRKLIYNSGWISYINCEIVISQVRMSIEQAKLSTFSIRFDRYRKIVVTCLHRRHIDVVQWLSVKRIWKWQTFPCHFSNCWREFSLNLSEFDVLHLEIFSTFDMRHSLHGKILSDKPIISLLSL